MHNEICMDTCHGAFEKNYFKGTEVCWNLHEWLLSLLERMDSLPGCISSAFWLNNHGNMKKFKCQLWTEANTLKAPPTSQSMIFHTGQTLTLKTALVHNTACMKISNNCCIHGKKTQKHIAKEYKREKCLQVRTAYAETNLSTSFKVISGFFTAHYFHLPWGMILMEHNLSLQAYISPSVNVCTGPMVFAALTCKFTS